MQLVYVDIGRPDMPLVVKLPGNAEVKRGETLRLDAAPSDLHIFDGEGHSFAPRTVVAQSGLTADGCAAKRDYCREHALARPSALLGRRQRLQPGVDRLAVGAPDVERRDPPFEIRKELVELQHLVAAHRLVDRHMHGVAFGRNRLRPAAGREPSASPGCA